MWHFRGSPPYLGMQAKRLGISQVLVDRARHNPELHRVSVLLGQLCERAHRARKEDGKPVLPAPELAQVRGSLEQVEQECSKLHALAAAAAMMIDECYAAFNLPAPTRHFAVLSDFDTTPVPTCPLPLGDGTVGTTIGGTAAAGGAVLSPAPAPYAAITV